MARKGGPKFYAVRIGKKPGVYTSWAEASDQVTGFGGAIHKSFPTRKEAQDWFNAGRSSSNTTNQQASSSSSTRQPFRRGPDHPTPQTTYLIRRGSDHSSPQTSYPGRTNRNDPAPARDNSPSPPAPPPAFPRYPIINTVTNNIVLPKKNPVPPTSTATREPPAKRARPNPDTNELIVVYTDGAAPGNGKRHATAGIGVYFGAGDPRNISKRLPGPLQTNQRAELMAVLLALQAFDPAESVEIRTDSQYSIDCVTKWYRGWVRNGWLSAKGAAVKNDDIIKPIRALIDERDAAGARTKFTKVAGHSGDPGNDAADRLAVLGARLPVVESRLRRWRG
ncbi:uncharacterized protein QC761_122230 [Podospora bellae-mahoneyi]|uniref:Ribonuclease H n=1 Tax=Podospora bellae-mahoneyi TaxID=2093777 RepID=A0ABR0FUB4_9PEZI|nr:hypothetical protein QC761_122230 [Podospora bellae-mahoneyi]